MSDRREALKRVIVDLNTQADFLLPNGAFPVSNRATMTPFEGVVELVDATPEPKQLVVVEGIHGLGIFQDADYVEIVSGFMDEVLGQ